MEDLAQHRESILEEYFDMPVLHHSTGFWKHADTEWREKQDRRSLSKVNITILEIKIESLVLMRDRISKGIKELESLFSQRIYLGGGSAGTGCFLFFRCVLMVWVCFVLFCFCFFGHDLSLQISVASETSYSVASMATVWTSIDD